MNKKLHKSILFISIVSIFILCLAILTACFDKKCQHEYESKEYIVAPTCTEAGREKRVCKFCGDETEARVPALNHDYDEGTTVDPTCTRPGSITKVCRNNPDHKIEEDIPATGHSYVIVGEPTVPATCEKNGVGYAECEVCDDPWPNYSIPALGHDWEVISSTPADCVNEGSETKKCNNCNDEVTDIVAPLGHDFAAFEIDIEATSTAAGSRHRDCKRCDYVHTTAIPRIGDNTTYKVSVSRVEGLPIALLKKLTVSVYDYDELVGTFPASSSLSQELSFTLPSTDYIIKLEEGILPKGYIIDEEGYSVSPSKPNCNIVLDTELAKGEAPEEYGYKKGYVMYDFLFNCYSGKKYQLSDLLKQYKGVVIVFYYTTCDPCNSEWGALNRAYEEFGDDIYVILMNTRGEDASKVNQHKQKHNLPYEVVNGQNELKRFGVTGAPTSFYIDCRGVINEKRSGSTSSFHTWFRPLIEIADKLGYEPEKPETETKAPQIIANGCYYSERTLLAA